MSQVRLIYCSVTRGTTQTTAALYCSKPAAMATRRISKDESAEVAGVGAPLPPVHAAIINKDATKLAELIQTGSAQVHPESLETPLHTAARVGSIDCLRWLLENRIKSPLDRARNGSTPAHYAAVYGRLEALKVK